MKTRRQKAIRWLVALLLAVALAGGAALFFPQHLLLVESGPVTADVLVVLGGGQNSERARYAVELYRAGAAPRILCSGLGDCEANVSLLKRAGVPAAAILRENQSRNTRENAQLAIPLLRRLGARRVIIVTTWYHSRRALACFEHYGPDLKFFSRPSYFGWTGPDWHSHGIKTYIRAEYFKTLGYWILYGVCPINLVCGGAHPCTAPYRTLPNQLYRGFNNPQALGTCGAVRLAANDSPIWKSAIQHIGKSALRGPCQARRPLYGIFLEIKSFANYS